MAFFKKSSFNMISWLLNHKMYGLFCIIIYIFKTGRGRGWGRPHSRPLLLRGIRCSSAVERPLWVRWIVGSIAELIVDPLSYFSFQPVLRDWYNKGHGMCYPVCGTVHIKEPLLLIGKGSPYSGGSMFPLTV